MKIFKYVFMAAAAIAAMSCIQEENPVTNPEHNGELVHMTFIAKADTDTKVAFTDSETVWNEGDLIKVIAKSGNVYEFKATSVDGSSATFEGEAENSDIYYAVSPASAYVGNNVAEGKIYANIPQNQNAVAGSFDPNAFLSVASSNGNSLNFKNSCSVVGFKLEEPAGVKSVRFTANEQTNIAGTGLIKTSSIPTHSWDGTYEGRSAFNMITLNAPAGGFVADTEYYLTIRANNCPKGITMYVEYEDLVKSRTSDKVLFDGQVANAVRSIGILDNNLTEITPYDSYQMGFDLVVGNKVYNKKTHGDAVKVTADDKSMFNAFNNGGIRFLDPASSGAIVLHSNVAVTSDAILVGNVTNGKVLVDMNGKNVNHTAKTVALKNLELDTDAYTNYVFANNSSTADADAFILDNCSVTGLVKPLWYVNVAGYTLKNLTLVDSDIALAAATNIIDLAKTTSSGNKVVNVKNCIMYGASNYVSRIINNTQATGVTWDADVNFENNTIYNLHAGSSNGLLLMSGANSVVFKNNLVSFYSLNATEYVIRIWKNTPTYTVENNHFWSRHYIEGVQQLPEDVTLYGTTKITWAAANITSGAYPFTSTVPGAGATR